MVIRTHPLGPWAQLLGLVVVGAAVACTEHAVNVVGPGPVEAVVVSPASVELAVGESRQLEAALRDTAGNPVSGVSVSWSSSDDAVATVSGSGLVTGQGTGMARIVATADGKSDTSAVTVVSPLPEIEALAPDSVMASDPAFTLTVAGGGFVDGSVVRWEGADRPTTFVSPSELRAEIGEEDVAEAKVARVTVFNPAPGGGESEPARFPVGDWCAVGSLSPGDRVQGSLTVEDCFFNVDGGARSYDNWIAAGSAGDEVQVDLEADFDAAVELATRGLDVLATDDDRGPGTHARIHFPLPEDGSFDGSFVVTATSAAAGSTGPYWLRLLRTTPVGHGSTTTGTIASASELDAYTFEAAAGDGILLRAAATGGGLDPDLRLSPVADAEAGGDADALPDGDELLVAVAVEPGVKSAEVRDAGSGTGSYELSLQRCRVLESFLGGTVTDALADSDCTVAGPAVFVTFEGAAGADVRVRMASSFENVLRLAGPDGVVVATAEGAGSGSDARIELSLPLDGTWVALASAAVSGATGDITVSIE